MSLRLLDPPVLTDYKQIPTPTAKENRRLQLSATAIIHGGCAGALEKPRFGAAADFGRSAPEESRVQSRKKVESPESRVQSRKNEEKKEGGDSASAALDSGPSTPDSLALDPPLSTLQKPAG